MHHEAEIGFVDSHAERVRGHHDRRLAGHERFLHAAAIFQSHPGMIDADLSSHLSHESVGNFVAGAARRRIDDSRPARHRQELCQLRVFPRLTATPRLEIQVGTSKPGHQHFRVLQFQQLGHIVADGGRGGGGQRDRGRIAQMAANSPKRA